MKIQRTINNTMYSIALLPHELLQAYREQQLELDLKVITEELNNNFEEKYGIQPAEFQKYSQEAARRMREYIEKYSLDNDEAKTEAISDLIIEKKGA